MSKKDAFPRTRSMRPIHLALEAFVATHGGKERLHLNALWENWPHVMGEEIACLGWPMGHKGSMLLVGAHDNMALQELTMQTYEIIERANAFMDSAYFETVKVTLTQGRRVLSAKRPERQAQPTPAPLPPPPGLGGLLGKLDPNSPFSRYYTAYVQSFRPAGSPQGTGFPPARK